jgi:hypothetical protein
MEKYNMKTNVMKRLLAMFGCLVMLATSSPWAFAQQWSIKTNVVLIHGRMDSSSEQFGVFDYDQAGAWGGQSPATTGREECRTGAGKGLP